MGILRPTMEHYPLAWVFFVPFIIITSFAVLNLFIGIIVDSMQILNHEDATQNTDELSDVEDTELALLNQKLDKILSEIERQNKIRT